MIESLLTLLISSSARAQTPNCSDLPKKVCDFFRQHGSEKFFDLPNGAISPNPLYKPEIKEPETTASVPEVQGFDSDVVKADIADLLDVPNLSARAKLTITNNIEEIFSAASDSTFLPMPLNKSGAKIQVVPGKKAVQEIRKALGDANFNKLQAYRQTVQDKINASGAVLARKILVGNGPAKEASYETLYADPAKVAARRAHVQAMFTDAKKYLLDIIGADKPRESWSAEQKNLAARIEGLSLQMLNLKEGSSEPLCENLGLNAFNDISKQTVGICPAMLWHSDAALAAVPAHEIWHSNDPCSIQNDLAKIDPAALKEFRQNPGVSEQAKADVEFLSGTPYLSPDSTSFVDQPELRSALVDAGVMTVMARRLDSYPEIYKGVYKCIAERYQFRTPDNVFRENMIAEHKQALSDYSKLSEKNQQAANARLRRYVETRKDCTALRGSTRPQMMEAIPDVFGALYMEKWLSEHPPRTEAERYLATSASQRTCTEKAPGFNEGDLSAGMVINYVSERSSGARDPHPIDAKRAMMEVDLPGIARALGCTRSQAGCFDHLSRVKTASAGAGATGATR